jgi:hypothetical protein
MIEQTNKMEGVYNSIFECISIDKSMIQTYDEKIQHLNETFRNVNLSHDTLKQMLNERNEFNSDIHSKLNQLNEINEHLKASNTFKPISNLSQSTFGYFSLVPYTNGPFKSRILSQSQSNDLINVCQFSSNEKWRLLYRGSRDGFGAKEFHRACDGHSPTLTILKAKASEYIFGAYTEATWGSIGFKSDPNSFIFSLTNRDNLPCKIQTNNATDSIYCHPNYVLCFGRGHDIFIANNGDKFMHSYTCLGRTYPHSQYANESDEAKSFLAGSNKFLLREIEVYEKILNN